RVHGVGGRVHDGVEREGADAAVGVATGALLIQERLDVAEVGRRDRGGLRGDLVTAAPGERIGIALAAGEGDRDGEGEEAAPPWAGAEGRGPPDDPPESRRRRHRRRGYEGFVGGTTPVRRYLLAGAVEAVVRRAVVVVVAGRA